MSILQATPFVPGRARGFLHRAGKAVSPDSIVILKQHELGIFDQRPAGILVVDAAPLSHSMIRLLTLGIPTVLISTEKAGQLDEGMEISIDGYIGTVIERPGTETDRITAPQPPPPGEAIRFEDGSDVLLCASIFSVDEAAFAVEQGAAAIGLVRSEFLLPENSRLPDRAFYESTLRKLCDMTRPLQVTIRLPDISADKPVPWLEPIKGRGGPLGMQGVRLYHEEALRNVTGALLDAINGLDDNDRLRLLLPYVTSLDEFSYWRSTIESRLGRSLPIGVMAESPVAVLTMPHWFDVADFVAIGCNDLMQCLFAADRDLVEVSSHLDPYSPELFRFLKQAADSAGDNIHKVQLCGLLTQIPGVMPVLLGSGYRTFSVSPVMIPYLGKTVSEISLSRAEQLAQQVCAAKKSAQVRDLLKNALVV